MPAQDGALEFPRGDRWAALGWLTAALVAASLLGPLCLPGGSYSVYGSYDTRDFLRGEWVLLGTLLAIPIYRAARAGWWSAPLVCLVSGAQMLFIADTAVDAMRLVGLHDPWFAGWYAVAAVQCGVFSAAGFAGARRDLADRRWLRLMRELTAAQTAAAARSRGR